MGKVTVIAILGLDLWFNSSDHLPPHFHAAKAGHWEIRVYLLTTTLGALDWKFKWQKSKSGPTTKELQDLRTAVCANRVKLLAEWESKVVLSEEPK